MPIRYSDYPPNWKTEIRPAILERDGHCCKFCLAPNHSYIFRGKIDDGTEVYQCPNGSIFAASNGEMLYGEEGSMVDIFAPDPLKLSIKVVLTIAHLDHDIANNAHENLAALCQRCHLRYDALHHAKNSKATREIKKQAATGQISMF